MDLDSSPVWLFWTSDAGNRPSEWNGDDAASTGWHEVGRGGVSMEQGIHSYRHVKALTPSCSSPMPWWPWKPSAMNMNEIEPALREWRLSGMAETLSARVMQAGSPPEKAPIGNQTTSP
jgi:hypothetical protein